MFISTDLFIILIYHFYTHQIWRPIFSKVIKFYYEVLRLSEKKFPIFPPFFLVMCWQFANSSQQLHIWYLPCLLIFKKLGYVMKYHKIFSLLCCFSFWELIYDLNFVFILLHNFVAWCGRWFFRNFSQNELELNYLNTLVIVSSEQNEIYRCQPHPGVRLHGIGVRRQPRSGPPG